MLWKYLRKKKSEVIVFSENDGCREKIVVVQEETP